MDEERPRIEDFGDSGHSRSLRTTLKNAREAAGQSAREVCDEIAEELRRRGDPDASPPHVNTLYAWERYERHPSISNFGAWAKVLGYRLVVELGDAAIERRPVLLRTAEATEAARLVDLMTPDMRQSILKVIRSMRSE